MIYPILYVEDDDTTRDVMSAILNHHFNEVFTASNGMEGWDLYLKIRPLVLIVDMKMPKLGGIDLIQKIRQIDNEIFIIVVSAHSDKEDLISSIHLNVNRYLIKPINAKEVIAQINEALRKYKEGNHPLLIAMTPLFSYDLKNKILYKKDQPFKITKIENQILWLLLKNRNRPVSYSQFEHAIWNEFPMTKYALRTHIMQLRKKLENQITIQNLSGEGYLLAL